MHAPAGGTPQDIYYSQLNCACNRLTLSEGAVLDRPAKCDQSTTEEELSTSEGAATVLQQLFSKMPVDDLRVVYALMSRKINMKPQRDLPDHPPPSVQSTAWSFDDLEPHCSVQRYVFDTGATHCLSKPTAAEFMASIKPSSLRVRGFHGTQQQTGIDCGVLTGFIVSPDSDPVKQPLTFASDTIEGIHDALFSFNGMYALGYNVCLCQPGEWSGMYQTDRATGEKIHKFPLTFDPAEMQWGFDIVVSKQPRLAQRMARIIEIRRRSQTSTAARAADATLIEPDDVHAVYVLATALAGSALPRVSVTTPADTVLTDDPDSIDPKGVTEGAFGRMTARQRHEALGHHGPCPGGCVICEQVNKSTHRIMRNPQPKHDPRPGHTWDADIIYWSTDGVVSVRGFTFTYMMVDRCTGTHIKVNLSHRDDVVAGLDEVLTELRNDSRFKQDYPIVNCLHLDAAGEFTGSEFLNLLKKFHIHQYHIADPSEKRDAGHIEAWVGKAERGVKRGMLTTMAPVQYWCYFVDHYIQSRNRLPLKRNVNTITGDAKRPIEELFSGSYDRKTCDRDLLAMNVPLQLALVTDKQSKGSDLSRLDRCTQAITLGLKTNSCLNVSRIHVMFNPFSGRTRVAKSFIILPMAPGRNAWEVLGLRQPLCPKTSHLRPTSERSTPAITLVKLPVLVADVVPNAVIEGVKTHGLGEIVGPPLIRMFDPAGNDLIPNSVSGTLDRGTVALPDILRVLDITRDPEIDYDSFETQIDRLESRPKDFVGRKVYQHFSNAQPPGTYEGIVTGHILDIDDGHFWTISWPAIGLNDADSCEYQQQEMIDYCINGDDSDVVTAAKLDTITQLETALHLPLQAFELYKCKDNDSFITVCNALVPKCDRRLYADWIAQTFGYGPADSAHPDALDFPAPFSETGKIVKGIKFKIGTPFPVPSGQSWQNMRSAANVASELSNTEMHHQRTVTALFATAAETARIRSKAMRVATRLSFDDCSEPGKAYKVAFQPSDDLVLQKLLAEHVPDSKYVTAIGKLEAPKSLKDAQSRTDWPLWEYAVQKEVKAFIRLDVHSEAMELKDVRARGYHHSPVRSHMIFDCKYDIVTNEFLKPKARWVAEGTPSQCRKGEHFFESYSPAPCPIATRVLQAIACGYNKKRHAADVDTAFLHARLEDREKIPIKLPPGMEIWRDGKCCAYVIALAGQYGMPSAAFYWQRCRDAWILEAFNTAVEVTSADPRTHSCDAKDTLEASPDVKIPTGNWKCKQLVLEPCMFIIDNVDAGTRTHVLIHVDDMDIVTDSDADASAILAKFHKRFGIRYCDPEIMLGIRRTMSTVDGVRFMELTMTTFVEDMFNEWTQTMAERGTPLSADVPETPFPENTILSVKGTEKHPRPSDDEISPLSLLYMHLVGQLLWLARMAMPDILFATSMLSRVLSCPGRDALNFGMRTVKYAHAQRHRGIRFRSDGCKLRASYDASHHPDPKDGKSQFGFSLLLFDGPIFAVSRKTARVGTSSTHNEYIAQAECAKCIVFVRNLLTEMGFPELCDAPTPTAGDNYTAVTQLSENRVTERCRFYLIDYHYVREIYEDGHFFPYWIDTLNNGSDIYTKSVPRQTMLRLRPRETGYSETVLDTPNLSFTPADHAKLSPAPSASFATPQYHAVSVAPCVYHVVVVDPDVDRPPGGRGENDVAFQARNAGAGDHSPRAHPTVQQQMILMRMQHGYDNEICRLPSAGAKVNIVATDSGLDRHPGGRGKNDVAFQAQNTGAGDHSPRAHPRDYRKWGVDWSDLAVRLRRKGITVVNDTGRPVPAGWSAQWTYAIIDADEWRRLRQFVQSISANVTNRPDWLEQFTVSGDDECASQSSILEDDVPQSRDYPIESAAAFGIFLHFCRIHDYRF